MTTGVVLLDELDQVLVEVESVLRSAPLSLRINFDRERAQRLVDFAVVGHQIGRIEFALAALVELFLGARVNPPVKLLKPRIVIRRVVETSLTVAADRAVAFDAMGN